MVNKVEYIHFLTIMANFGPLTAEIGLASLGHPSKFQPVPRLAFVIAATSLIGANQTLRSRFDTIPACDGRTDGQRDGRTDRRTELPLSVKRLQCEHCNCGAL